MQETTMLLDVSVNIPLRIWILRKFISIHFRSFASTLDDWDGEVLLPVCYTEGQVTGRSCVKDFCSLEFIKRTPSLRFSSVQSVSGLGSQSLVVPLDVISQY